MRIGFLDVWPESYSLGDVFTRPLGGTQSAMSYLAMALAAAGHDVFYICNTPAPASISGVSNLSVRTMTPDSFRNLRLDVLIMFQVPGNGARLRGLLDKSCRLLFLSMDYAELDSLDPLHRAEEQDAFDAVIVVSQWQQTEFIRHFALPAAKVKVMRNAVGPAFEHLFAPGESILAQKPQPPILAYTSTPFRGLNPLLKLFPEIRRRVPGVTLQVYSSLQVYSVNPAIDQANFGALYDACRRTEGVVYVGSLPQPQLAARLRSVSLLAYPNTYAETSCISLMEALAAGCAAVTTSRAALPETAAGFATLVAGEPGTEIYDTQFVACVVESLHQQVDHPQQEERRRRQVEYFTTQCSWASRATEWTQLLASENKRLA